MRLDHEGPVVLLIELKKKATSQIVLVVYGPQDLLKFLCAHAPSVAGLSYNIGLDCGSVEARCGVSSLHCTTTRGLAISHCRKLRIVAGLEINQLVPYDVSTLRSHSTETVQPRL